ncbi:MAG: hypothetical protein KDD47_19815, partial [Acidobacteria bacterium]|nr:hypothetical protein [Acidobacteriota bacterium]
ALLGTRTEPQRRELADRVEGRLRQAAENAARSEPRTSSRSSAPASGSSELADGAALQAGITDEGTGESLGSSSRGSSGPPAATPRSRDRASTEDDQARQVTLYLDEVNALLQERVARWEARRRSSPLPIKNPILAIEDDHLVLFVQLMNRGSEMLLALPVDVAIDDRGGVARLLGVRLGQLPLPGLEALPRLLRSTGDPGLAELAERAEAAAGGYPFDPILPSEGGPPLRIVGLEIDSPEQALHLTLGPRS